MCAARLGRTMTFPPWFNGRNQGDEARGDHGTVEQKGVPGSWRLLAVA